MADLDFAQLLEELSSDSPCGEDLEYDPLFQEVEQESEGTPERSVGDSVVSAVEPDWRSVYDKSLRLFDRTRDVSAATYLTRAAMHLHGYQGLNQGLQLIKGLLDRYWDSVYPIQDPDDDYPVLRMNVIASFNDKATFLDPIKSIPLTHSQVMGKFSWRDIQLASGTLSSQTDDENLPKLSEIDAAFKDTELNLLEEAHEALVQALAEVREIATLTQERAGAINAPELGDLVTLLREVSAYLAEQIIQCGGSAADAEGADEQQADGTAAAVSGVTRDGIQSREDVKRTLEQICDYYDKYEPSSPIPFILKRAKRLLYMDFQEIMQDLAPDGMTQARNVFGDESDNG